ncbi:Tn7 transposase TnsA N-terminal domain-containing protein [Paucibacter sp. TC2R-5]|uniref:Tn7 transposase TnsA N-terminal domain-containing protein n=1 Tax=Paucibacter sp. TC2R-5 TaxID=2893555 RepID=UPI0021E4BADB|nr:Tn7 transposase TnsA N-terminal domain-containing protein [Paucibacter sp. TC2R-5]MCV2360405.1 Tn7 transposase TnsA N-terminal domain-containing protein [Paucibacter sp. TC2R-5]
MKETTRKVVTRSPKRSVYIINLPGLVSRPVHAESSYERDFVLKAVLFSGFTDLKHQPFKLELPSGRSYTPDFLVEASGQRYVVEVKRKSKVSEYRSLFDEASARLAEASMKFLVVTEQQLHATGQQNRAKEIIRYRKHPIGDSRIERLLTVIRDHPGGMSIGRLRYACGFRFEWILTLLAHKQVTTGSNLPLDYSVLVFPLPLSTSHEFQFERWIGAAPWAANT